MFVNSVLDYWGRSEEFPLFSGCSPCMDFCYSKMLKECKAYDLIMNDAPPRRVPKSKPSPRIAKMVQRHEELEYDWIRNDAAPPSLPTPKPKPPKRIKKDYPFEIQIRRAKNGGDSVVLMSPNEETPHLESGDQGGGLTRSLLSQRQCILCGIAGLRLPTNRKARKG